MTLPLLRCETIGPAFVHGFTGRAGGVSAPPFDSLNLGGKWGDDPAHVAENRRRLAEAVGGAPCAWTELGSAERSPSREGAGTLPGFPGLFVARQVHGTMVRRVRRGDDRAHLAGLEADGLCSDEPGVVLGVFVADCVPVLMADARTGACAAVHAGWRGTVGGILPQAVHVLAAELGARPEDLQVALGPAIGPCCFEVGLEVVAAFEAAIPDARARGIVRPSPRGRADKAHLDLHAANRLLLEQAGVNPRAVVSIPGCTHCDRARFFSFRRDGASTGQQMGVIGRR